MTTHTTTRTRDLPARLRDSATDIEARARRDLAGYPDRMQPFLDEAADLRAAADRLEALERDVAKYRRRWETCEDRRRSMRPVALVVGASPNEADQ